MEIVFLQKMGKTSKNKERNYYFGFFKFKLKILVKAN